MDSLMPPEVLKASATPGTANPDSEAVPAASRPASTYGQILRSSALIGGSATVTVAVSIVRVKVLAVLLGPTGVGLVGLYSSILDLTQSIAGMGINNSGVRQIAQAAASGDPQRIARTAAVLRRTSLILGVLGALLLVAFRRPVSQWTFNSEAFAVPVALLGTAVFFRSISDGQGALIQGLRRIGDLARIAVLAAVIGTTAGIVIVYFLREDGIVPMLVTVAAATLGTSWWYRRKIPTPSALLTRPQMVDEAGALLKLGFAFMGSAVLTTGAAYAIRTILSHTSGLEAAGLYQSAWALGGLYVGFILQAMGSDFYPRLTAVANDHGECNRLVNEQAQIGLLRAGPGVIATLTFAPLVVALFYSQTFSGAVEPLRWICLGMALRVVAWPMGYIVLAKGARSIFLATEIGAAVVHVALALLLVQKFGPIGASMAFFGLYVWHSVLIYVIVHRLTAFRWSAENQRTGMLVLPVIGIVFGSFLILPLGVAGPVGLVAVLSIGVYSLRAVCRLIPLDRFPSLVQTVLIWLRLHGRSRI
jgi:enterobacterial common antigen flippase